MGAPHGALSPRCRQQCAPFRAGCAAALDSSKGNTADKSKFGPYGYCEGDKYAQYQCSLKQSDNPSNPADYGGGGESFISGSIPP